MKEKLNKNETLNFVMQLRPSTKEKHPDDCRPMSFLQVQFSFVKYYWVTSFNDHS